VTYRNGTYIAFHAEGTPNPTASDIKYFNIMKAWHEHDDIEFKFINSHDKVSSVRDSSLKATLRRSLVERMNNSRNFLLIVGSKTRFDNDWVPFEIAQAADRCYLPFIIAYTGYLSILNPIALASLWPPALKSRIDNGSIKAIHVPFQRNAIDAAIREYDLSNKPNGALIYWSEAAHRHFGISI
jgi:MTH538 TIR-like domain (DUF1863)